mmetsp:Transcript_35013/g.59445  ORF Transcript_35013/g.59445 Transcript_35013/m.59445 type:complete len:325 (-) Transcript_35013:8-982(-)
MAEERNARVVGGRYAVELREMDERQRPPQREHLQEHHSGARTRRLGAAPDVAGRHRLPRVGGENHRQQSHSRERVLVRSHGRPRGRGADPGVVRKVRGVRVGVLLSHAAGGVDGQLDDLPARSGDDRARRRDGRIGDLPSEQRRLRHRPGRVGAPILPVQILPGRSGRQSRIEGVAPRRPRGMHPRGDLGPVSAIRPVVQIHARHVRVRRPGGGGGLCSRPVGDAPSGVRGVDGNGRETEIDGVGVCPAGDLSGPSRLPLRAGVSEGSMGIHSGVAEGGWMRWRLHLICSCSRGLWRAPKQLLVPFRFCTRLPATCNPQVSLWG